MNPLKFVTRPVKDLTDAIVMPFKAVFVVGLTGLINAMTYHGVWWFKWVALGMGIAVVVSLERAAKTLLNSHRDMPIADVLMAESTAQRDLLGSRDQLEAVAAQMEGRAADFAGR